MKSLVVIGEYADHAHAVDREFRREADMFSDRIHCGRGCSMCCSQMFSISSIEAAYISKSVKSMPAEERERLRAAARDYVARARIIGAHDGQDETEQSVTPRPGLRLPCPALQGDACSIYEARPLICRKWGIPVFNPAKPLELQACELNFRPGETIEVDGIVEPQAKLLEEWVRLKQRAQRLLERPISTATVAEALIDDYEEIVFGGLPGDCDDQS
jgi:Fe-S-cluster containining protein